MLYPSNFEYCLLRRILVRWAARFTSDETLQAKLVEKTIRKTLQDFLLKDDGAAIDLELLATMRRLALCEFGVKKDQQNQAPPVDVAEGRGASPQ